MVTYDAACELWGPDEMVRLAPDQLEGFRLPESSRRFFCEVGLPRQADPEIHFDLEDGGLAVLSSYAANLVTPPPEWDHVYQVGGDPLGDLCIDGNRGGIVVHLDVENPGSLQYVNSRIEVLAEFLYRWNRLESDQSAEQFRQWLAEFRRQMETADPEALRDPEGWWSVLIEDAENLGC